MPSAGSGALFVLQRARGSHEIEYEIRIASDDREYVGHATPQADAWSISYQGETPPSWAHRFVENLMRTTLRAARAEAGDWPRRMQRWRKKPEGA